MADNFYPLLVQMPSRRRNRLGFESKLDTVDGFGWIYAGVAQILVLFRAIKFVVKINDLLRN